MFQRMAMQCIFYLRKVTWILGKPNFTLSLGRHVKECVEWHDIEDIFWNVNFNFQEICLRKSSICLIVSLYHDNINRILPRTTAGRWIVRRTSSWRVLVKTQICGIYSEILVHQINCLNYYEDRVETGIPSPIPVKLYPWTSTPLQWHLWDIN